MRSFLYLKPIDFYKLGSLTSLLKCTVLLSGLFLFSKFVSVFAQYFILLDNFPPLDESEKSDKSHVLISFARVKNFQPNCIFLDKRTVFFWRTHQ